jgi:hypothetical protein
VVREHYLRDDIPCGAASCSSCDAAARRLNADAAAILVIDTNVVLHQVALLPRPHFSYLACPYTVVCPIADALRGCCRSICWRIQRLRISSCSRWCWTK